MKKQVNKQWVFWGTCLGYVLFAILLLIAFHGPKTLWNRYLNPRVANTLYVRKWNLYTADPSRRVEKLYKVEGNKLTPVDVRPFTSAYSYGLSRIPKVIAQEIQVITRDTSLTVSAPAYSLTADYEASLAQLINADTLRYINIRKQNIVYLQGRYVIQTYAPLTRDDIKEHRTIVPMRLLAVNIERP